MPLWRGYGRRWKQAFHRSSSVLTENDQAYWRSVESDNIRALLAHMDGLKKDSEMLGWLLPKFSGKGLREAGIVYGGGVESILSAIAAAMAEGADRV